MALTQVTQRAELRGRGAKGLREWMSDQNSRLRWPWEDLGEQGPFQAEK